MPTISQFFGIQIRMYYKDTGPHNHPHFHAAYQHDVASVAVDDGTILSGSLPRRQRNIVLKWLDIHRKELLSNWQRVLVKEPLVDIAPFQKGDV
jgi:hypothetical protein